MDYVDRRTLPINYRKCSHECTFTMPTFSAYEDRSLLLLVVLFEGPNGVIDWKSVTRYFSPGKKKIEDLQARIEFLKCSDTALLSEIPASYVASSSLQGVCAFARQRWVYDAIDETFRHFTKSDVRQPSGKQHLNAGELAPDGVTAILNALDLTRRDVFVDIGSGTGSVLAQVVLQSEVSRAIGLEIRPELAEKSRVAFDRAKDKYQRFPKVEVLTGDVKCLSPTIRARLLSASVIFSNNAAFEPQDNLDLQEFVCSFEITSELRVVMLSQRFCFRCHGTCNKKFCKWWKETDVIMAKTCWMEKPVELYVFRQKHIIDKSLLALLNEL
jgi:hypothetical protein